MNKTLTVIAGIIILLIVGVLIAGIYKFNFTNSDIYFGNEVRGDLNGDGKADRAYIITEQPGGSGTFYYVTALIASIWGEKSTNKVLLGDRIAPQPMTIENGILIVNYADRRLEDSFVVPPSVGKTLRLKLNPDTLQFQAI